MLTAADLKTRYPEFKAVADARINAVLTETYIEVGDAWIADYRDVARLLLAAHRLAMEGALTGDRTPGASTPGPVSQKSVGSVSVSYNAVEGRAAGETQKMGDYGRTYYGRHYLEIRARNFPAIVVF